MTQYISFLRGINVGGNKRIKMADLRQLYTDLGYQAVQSILASGNVVFHSEETDPATISQSIETTIQERYGFETRIILRTCATMTAALTANPFTERSDFDAQKMLIFFLKQAPDAEAFMALQNARDWVEELHSAGDTLYVYYHNGIGRSKLTNQVIERYLGIGTGRNWNTVNKLLALC